MSSEQHMNGRAQTASEASTGETQDDQSVNRVGDAAATASTVFKSTSQWLTRAREAAGHAAKEAGKRIDKAADTINDTFDHYTQQVCTFSIACDC